MSNPSDDRPVACPSEAEITAILADDSLLANRPELMNHLDRCLDCKR